MSFMQVNGLGSKLKGMYRISIYRKDRSLRYEGDWFENIITNNGIDSILRGDGFVSTMFVGSGSSTPTVSQTALDNLLMTSSTNFSDSDTFLGSSPYYTTRTIVKRFSAVPSGGYNISEIGIGTTSSSLFSRALILDGSGNPVTLSLLQDEILETTYQLRSYPSLIAGDYTQSGVDISGTSTTFTWRAANAGSSFKPVQVTGMQAILYTGAVGAVTSSPAGTASSTVSGTLASYTNGSYERSASLTFGLTVANQTSQSILVTGASSPSISPFRYQASISPSITKTSSQILAISYKVSFARL